MSSTDACRVCLASYVPLQTIENTPLQELYEKLTSSLLVQCDKPQRLCRVCHALMKTLHTFTTKAIKSNRLLTEMLQNGVPPSRCKFSDMDRVIFSTLYLTVSPVESIHIDPEPKRLVQSQTVTYEVNVTKDKKNNVTGAGIGNMLNVIVKTEDVPIDFDENDDYKDPDFNYVAPKSDSEDDVPLNNIRLRNQNTRSTTIEEVKYKDETVERERRQTDLSSMVKLYAREIILTKEQQIQEITDRAKSTNYINSPFKCDVCFKGFLDENAFQNHRVKHDKKSGPYKCEICHVRYRAGRLLRSHTATAHRRRYECIRCLHRTHTVFQARDHERWHSGYKYECKLCGHKFSKPTSYATHKRKHHPTEHVCTLCGDGCVSVHGLRMHMSKAHARNEIPAETTVPAAERFCAECRVQFVTKEAYSRHVLTAKVHREARANGDCLECKLCGVVLPSTVALSLHSRGHERALRAHPPLPAVPKAICDQCSRHFPSRSKLLAHMKRVHLGIKYTRDIVCEQCGKRCATNASLVYHQRTHTGERPHTCATCRKGFADSNQLRIHIRIHTGERPYGCSVCGKRFNQKPALNRHFRIHTGSKPYICQVCSKTFTQSNSLKLHVRTVHLKLPVVRKRDGCSAQNTGQSNERKGGKDEAVVINSRSNSQAINQLN